MIKYRQNNIDLMFEMSSDTVTSVTDCTGLIPFAPTDSYEYRSYGSLIDYRADEIVLKKRGFSSK